MVIKVRQEHCRRQSAVFKGEKFGRKSREKVGDQLERENRRKLAAIQERIRGLEAAGVGQVEDPGAAERQQTAQTAQTKLQLTEEYERLLADHKRILEENRRLHADKVVDEVNYVAERSGLKLQLEAYRIDTEMARVGKPEYYRELEKARLRGRDFFTTTAGRGQEVER